MFSLFAYLFVLENQLKSLSAVNSGNEFFRVVSKRAGVD